MDTVHVATIDNFQGEEVKSVIISSVLSDDNGDNGFVPGQERVNVMWTVQSTRRNGDLTFIYGILFYVGIEAVLGLGETIINFLLLEVKHIYRLYHGGFGQPKFKLVMSELPESSDDWCVLVLAAGYGSRLLQNLKASNDRALEKEIIHLPKALLPVCGITLLDYWLQQFKRPNISPCIKDVYVLSNQRYYSQFVQFAVTRGIPTANILNDKKVTPTDDQTEVSDLLNAFIQIEEKLRDCNILVVSGDVLLDEQFEVSDLILRTRARDEGTFAVVTLSSSTVVDSTDIVTVNGDQVLSVISRKEGAESHGALTLVPVYALTRPVVRFLTQHLTSPAPAVQSLRSHGALLSWLVQDAGHPCRHVQATRCFDIDTMDTYLAASQYFSALFAPHLAQLPTVVSHSCPARIGLMGNPSDGFNGKTLSFLLHNFAAVVTITAGPVDNPYAVELVPHPEFDCTRFDSLGHLHEVTLLNGYYGGLRLLQATCKAFAATCSTRGITKHLLRGLRMSYDSTIPRRVGLSGSSAIIVAAYRSLMDYYDISLSDLGIQLSDFPQMILDIERQELDISAGLQDRVIQTYGGLVHMDFTRLKVEGKGIYTPMDPSLLPELYLAYNTDAGGDSGAVHSSVRDRWMAGDADIHAGMQQLGYLADSARACLLEGNREQLASLMDQNFALRRKMYGDAVVGEKNLQVVELANKLGLAAKFTGSGGALVCMRRNGGGWLSEEQEALVRHEFDREGFEFTRMLPTPAALQM